MDALTSILTTGTVTPATLATGTIMTGTIAPSYTTITWEPPAVYEFSDWKIVDTPQGHQLRFKLRGRNYAVSCEELLREGDVSRCSSLLLWCGHAASDKENENETYDTTEIDKFLDEFITTNKEREE